MTGEQGISFASVMKKMHTQSRTGILDVAGPEGTWEIHLHNGSVTFVRTPEADEWILGRALVSRGVLTAEKLQALDRWASRRGLRLEDVLVSRGGVSEEVLYRIQTLRMREQVLPLFRRVGVLCHFRHEAPGVLEGSRPIPVVELLKEAERRLRTWPMLDRRIQSIHGIYGKCEGAAAEVFGDLGTDLQTRTTGPGGMQQPAQRLNANARIVFYELNGIRTLSQVALSSGLGDFETTLAVHRLMERGFVELVRLEGPGEPPPSVSFLPAVVRGLGYAAVLVLVAWVAFSFSPADWSGEQSIYEQPLSESVDIYEEAHLRRALNVRFLRDGSFPTRIGDLALDGWIDGEDLSLRRDGREWVYRASTRKDRYGLTLQQRALVPPPKQDSARDAGK